MTVRRSAMAAVVGAAVLVGVWSLLRTTPSIAQAAVAPARAHWEYMSVVIEMFSGTLQPEPGRFTFEQKESFTLQTGQAKKEFATLAELAKHLGVEPKHDGMAVILNALGAEGWELVSVDSYVTAMPLFAPAGATYWPTSNRQRWTLKRPA